MLRAAGATCVSEASDPTHARWTVEPGPIALGDYVVEPDLSNAAAFLAAAMVTGGGVTVPGWPSHTTQPGDDIRGVFEAMGGICTLDDRGLTVTGPTDLRGRQPGSPQHRGIDPTVAAVAVFACTPSRLHGVAHLRGHETDRLAALVTDQSARRASTRIGGWTRDRARTTLGRRYRHVPRSPNGDLQGDRRAPGAWHPRREHRHDRKDDAAIRRNVGRPHERQQCAVSPVNSTKTMCAFALGALPGHAASNAQRTKMQTDAFVVTIDRGRITCALTADPTTEVVSVKARELGRKAVAVGDNVGLVGDLSGRPDTLARLVRIDPRKTELRRTADDTDPTSASSWPMSTRWESSSRLRTASAHRPHRSLPRRCLRRPRRPTADPHKGGPR